MERAPIGGDPVADGLAQPSPRLTMALLVTPGLAALVSMVVGSSRRFLAGIDEPLIDPAGDAGWIAAISSVGVLGSSLFAIVASGLLWLASFRCRVLVMAVPVAVITSFVTNNVRKVIIERERPPVGTFADRMDSFPSGHVLLVTILAALTPLAIAVMDHSTRPIRWLRWVAEPSTGRARLLLAPDRAAKRFRATGGRFCVGELTDGIEQLATA